MCAHSAFAQFDTNPKIHFFTGQYNLNPHWAQFYTLHKHPIDQRAADKLKQNFDWDLEFLDNEFDYLGIGRHRNHAFWCLQMKNKLDTWILAYILQK